MSHDTPNATGPSPDVNAFLQAAGQNAPAVQHAVKLDMPFGQAYADRLKQIFKDTNGAFASQCYAFSLRCEDRLKAAPIAAAEKPAAAPVATNKGVQSPYAKAGVKPPELKPRGFA
jgi:hypothetical protein